jgi:hypothetical protein
MAGLCSDVKKWRFRDFGDISQAREPWRRIRLNEAAQRSRYKKKTTVAVSVKVCRAMKKYSIFHIPVMSFYWADLYRDVGLNWKGTNFGYLVLLLAVCWIPIMIRMHRGISNFVKEEAPAIVEQVPAITITEGEVSADVAQPYYITAPESNDVLAVIDTTGAITRLHDANAMCLLTKTELIFHQGEHEVRTHDLSHIDSFSVDSERIMGWLRMIGKLLVPASYPFAVLFSYAYRIIQALIYALIGTLFASICHVKLSYDALLRLAVVAVTPCVIAGTIISLTGAHIPALVYLIAALGYLFYGVRSCGHMPADEIETLRPGSVDSGYENM